MVYPRTESQEATRRAVELADRLLSRGVQVAVPELMLHEHDALPDGTHGLAQPEMDGGIDLVVSLGGDGTLRALTMSSTSS